jgi:hypothetical protein
MIADNFNAFRTHLVKRTLPLDGLKGWMRMRVHLGHISSREYQVDFGNSKYSFNVFTNMMKRSRVSTAGIFDRNEFTKEVISESALIPTLKRMDVASAVKAIQTIVGRPQDFCPKKSVTSTLSDVQLNPRHTEIVFITTSRSGGQDLRLEAEIDWTQTTQYAQGPYQTHYQIGTTSLFHDDRRNKHVGRSYNG